MGDVSELENRIPPPQKTSDQKRNSKGGGVRIVRTQENSKMYTTPRIALAMFIMAFVGLMRGLWGSPSSACRAHTSSSNSA